jgi:hypothetical protein
MRLLYSLLICLKILRMHYITGQREYSKREASVKVAIMGFTL